MHAVQKHTGEWQLTTDVRALYDVAAALAAVVSGMLQLLHEPEAKEYTWYVTTDVANAFFSMPLAEEAKPQLPSPAIVCNMSGTGCCKGWKRSPTICHGIIHKTLKQHTSREFFHCIDDVLIRGKTLEEVLSNGQQVIFIFPNSN